MFALLQAILGFRPDAPRGRLHVDPLLPEWLPDLTVIDLRLGKHQFDIRFWRADGETRFEVLRGDPKAVVRRPFGGQQPAAAWQSVFVPAATVDVGQPQGAMSLWATGTDPQNSKLTYKIYGRQYGNALVLFKPISFAAGQGSGTTDDATDTTTQLNGRYRVLNSDGTLGPVITSISLRNGEGVTLMKA